MAVVAPVRAGFCRLDVHPPGPAQTKVAPARLGVAKLMVAPEHTGLFTKMAGCEGPVRVTATSSDTVTVLLSQLV